MKYGKKRLHQNGPRNNQNIGSKNYMFCVSKIYTIEHYSFEADFSAFFCIHMKKLPNSLKYLQENDEIPEKVAAKDISQKYICTMVELKSETKTKQLALTTTMKIS